MTQISLDPEQQEVQITRSIGKSGDGKITINREGGGAIEINLGIASFGLTTDYGGAISLGIVGQEVTWGREGGTIHLGFGGFEVDVEARDCIVTEVKSIAGIVVAQRSYPDPGCKLPDPPLPPKSLPIPVPNPTVENEIILPDSDQVGWCMFTEVTTQLAYNFSRIIKVSRTARDIETPKNSYEIPFSVDIVSNFLPHHPTLIVPKGSFLFSDFYARSAQTAPGEPLIQYPVLVYYYTAYNFAVVCFFGSARSIKKFITDYNAWSRKDFDPAKASDFPTGINMSQYYPTAFIPLEDEPAGPFLPTGNKPPMRDCCEEILDYLADFEEAFDINRLLKDKFPVSNTFMAPECDPASVTKAKSYYEIMQCNFRMMAHGMIFEPKTYIKDADAAKAGDQEVKTSYLNATGWTSAVSEALMEVKDDGNVATNMDIRSGFGMTQLMVGLADAIYKLDAILDCLGFELAQDTETVETPYNLMIRLGKGLGENNERQLDLNKDEATEALLPQLLQTKKNKIKIVKIHPRTRTVQEILQNIEAAMGGNSNG